MLLRIPSHPQLVMLAPQAQLPPVFPSRDALAAHCFTEGHWPCFISLVTDKNIAQADLSRLRQNDLPLSDVERGRLSYDPRRDTSRRALAILEECKGKVQHKWSSNIKSPCLSMRIC